jgi:hypothetical protein
MVKVEEIETKQFPRMSSSRSNDTNEMVVNKKKVETKKESVFSKLFGSKNNNKNINNNNTPTTIINDNKQQKIQTTNLHQQSQQKKLLTKETTTTTATTTVSKNKLRCRVSLLDDDVKVFDVDKLATGQELFQVICRYLGLIENDYFSLTYRDANNMKVCLKKFFFWKEPLPFCNFFKSFGLIMKKK